MKYITTPIQLLLMCSTGYGQELYGGCSFTALGRAAAGSAGLSDAKGETFYARLPANHHKLTQCHLQPELDLRVGIAQAAACDGANICVPFTASGYVYAAIVFAAELRDMNVSFANPVVIGSTTAMLWGNVTDLFGIPDKYNRRNMEDL